MQDFIIQILENSVNIGWWFMLVGGGGMIIYFLHNYLHGEDPLTGDITNLDQTGNRRNFFKICFITLVTPALLATVITAIAFSLIATLIGIPTSIFVDGVADDDEDEEDNLWNI